VNWQAFWQAHGETAWGALVGVIVTIIFGYLFYRLQERTKRASWEILSRNRIIRAGESQRKRLKVVYDSTEVENPNLTVIRLGNRGKDEIRAEDWDPPISLDFSPAKIISYDIAKRSVPAIGGQFSDVQDSRISFRPTLLNRHEWFDFHIVTDGELIDPRITGRIAGETHELGNINDEHRFPTWVTVGATILLGAGIAIGMFSTFTLGMLSGWPVVVGAISITIYVVYQIPRVINGDANLPGGRWKKAKNRKAEASA
jgi:hypothetical protein